MNCKFCNNLVKLGPYHPANEFHTPSHTKYDHGWCHNCPIPIFYLWESVYFTPIPIKQILCKIILCDVNYISKMPYYAFNLDFENNRSSLSYYPNGVGQFGDVLVRLNHIPNINPINFNQKLKTYLTFS